MRNVLIERQNARRDMHYGRSLCLGFNIIINPRQRKDTGLSSTQSTRRCSGNNKI